MVFDENAIMDALGKKFDDLGYSLKYHKALMEASKQTRPESTFKRNMPSCVQEALPKRMRKPMNFKDLFWEEWNDGKLYAMDPDTREYYSPDEWAQYKYLKQQQIFASWEAPPPAAVQMQEGYVSKDGRWRWSVKCSKYLPNREESTPPILGGDWHPDHQNEFWKDLRQRASSWVNASTTPPLVKGSDNSLQ